MVPHALFNGVCIFQFSRGFFSDDATQQMLNKWRHMLCPHDRCKAPIEQISVNSGHIQVQMPRLYGSKEIDRYTIEQSWACVSKMTLRLAPVRLFQTVSRLALSRFFQPKKFASLAFRVIAYRVSKFFFFFLNLFLGFIIFFYTILQCDLPPLRPNCGEAPG